MHARPVLAPAIAAAAVVGVTYVVCALASWLAPEQTIRLFSTMVHAIDLEAIRRSPAKALSGLEAITGFVWTVLGGFVAGALFGWVQSKVSGRPAASSN